MTTTLAVVVLAGLLAAPQQADTTITIPAGERLDVHTQGGQIVVSTWDRQEVRIEAEYGSRDQIRVTTSGSVVRVRADSRGGIGIVDYRITTPVGTDLDLGGLFTEIRVEGAPGRVRANTVHGDLEVRGGAGEVSLETVQGQVRIQGVRGTVHARSVGGQVRIVDVQGPVDAETVSGGVVLENIRSDRVTARAVSGNVFYDGVIEPGGHYAFMSHSGRITLAVPEPLDATVTTAMMSGSLSSSFGGFTTTGQTRGRRQTFTSGSGNAVVDLESFSGNIRIVRRGEVSIPPDR